MEPQGINIFIGPRSNHSLRMSVTNLVTHKLTTFWNLNELTPADGDTQSYLEAYVVKYAKNAESAEYAQCAEYTQCTE